MDYEMEKEGRREDPKDTLSRRGFLKGGTLMAAGIAGSSVFNNSVVPGGDNSIPQNWLPEKWDEETDILIVGYGEAGASAAIAAKKQGSDVIIIEVAPEGLHGGNSTSSGGGWTHPWDKELYFEHLQKLCFYFTPDNYLRDHAEACSGILDWMDELEIEYVQNIHNYSHFFTKDDPPRDPLTGEVITVQVADSGIDSYRSLKPEGGPAKGIELFRMLEERVAAQGVPVFFETRGLELVQNPLTKEILGIRAQDKNGNDLYFKGRKATLLCMGGYENNPTLTDNHTLPGLRLYPSGTIYNRGDGVYMSAQVGAELWHMAGIEWVGFGVRIFGDDQGAHSDYRLLDSGFIVNRHGQRMYNEDKQLAHTKEFPATYFKGYADDSSAPNEFYGVPAYAIFDETRRLAGSTGFFTQTSGTGFVVQHELYEWSPDNSKEIESGFIKKGDTIRELAENQGINPDLLEETFNNFNKYATDGFDPEFGREKFSPLLTPPFYSIELWPTLINTQGGPKHSNLDGRCLDNFDRVIPRLYACGELGSVYSMLYHGSGNNTEAIMTGKLAAEDAAKLEPWE